MLADEVATFTRNDKALNEPEFKWRQHSQCAAPNATLRSCTVFPR